jgi:hypothetical protein
MGTNGKAGGLGQRKLDREVPPPTLRLLYNATPVEGWFLKMPMRWAARTSLARFQQQITQHKGNHDASFTQTTGIR